MTYEVIERNAKYVDAITKSARKADALYLATDLDREGEAISWHILEVLKERKALEGKKVCRVVFHEITPRAIAEAVANPREISTALVNAQQARRALDYLVGFNLSPLLWKKIRRGLSAGRVQSPALRLICEREAEIEKFVPREYWTVEADMSAAAGPFTARLSEIGGEKVRQFTVTSQAQAEAVRQQIMDGSDGAFSVVSVEKKQRKRHPAPPFITSTLQQEAVRKLGFTAQRAMRVAQQLYEGIDTGNGAEGLITYMRTDSLNLAAEAVDELRDFIKSEYGPALVPAKPHTYKTKSKNAQEAHEAIRPTDVTRSPDTMGRELEGAQARLYDLIWKRAVASQMASAEMDQTAVDIAAKDARAQFRATGSVIAFDGFLKLYREDEDDRAADARAGILPGAAAAEDDESRILPPMREKEALKHGDIAASQHFTQPPPRYSEATLVKRLEELGIGRPSTYASILQRLQDLKYVSLEKRRFIAQDLGRMVTTFLVRFFEKYVDTGFTSAMEERLDEISGGRAEWRAVMHAFWDEFSRAVEATKDLKVRDVIDALDEDLGPHVFPARGDGTDPRVCPTCAAGRLGLRLGRGGAFIGLSLIHI